MTDDNVEWSHARMFDGEKFVDSWGGWGEMTDDVKYLVINYDDQLDGVVDSVNYLLQDYGLVFEEDDNKNNGSYENGDGRMWWVLKEMEG